MKPNNICCNDNEIKKHTLGSQRGRYSHERKTRAMTKDRKQNDEINWFKRDGPIKEPGDSTTGHYHDSDTEIEKEVHSRKIIDSAPELNCTKLNVSLEDIAELFEEL